MYFKKFEDVTLKLNKNNELQIKIPFLKNWLSTTDIVQLHGENEFEILGRSDFLIKTGGIKINPEQIENLIYKELKINFNILISSINDSTLGEKIVLYIPIDQNILMSNLEFLNTTIKYSKPYQIIKTKFPLINEFGKPNRKFFIAENQ